MAEVQEEWAKPADRILYVLKLEDECFYIGQSRIQNFEGRIKKHFKGKGSAWTRSHKPIEIIEQVNLYGSYRDVELAENQKVVEYMRQHGISKVRGGFFVNADDNLTVKNLKHHNLLKEVEK